MRYFYVQGDAETPQRFWIVLEISKEDSEKDTWKNGYIKTVKNDEINKSLLLIQHGFKNE